MALVRRARVAVRRVIAVLGVALVALLALATVLHVQLFHQLTRIEGAFSGLKHRPPPAGDDTMTMLVVLADGRAPGGAAGPDWLPESGATAALVVHVAGDRRSAVVAALPLDAELGASVARGPAFAVGAAEQRTELRVDHLVVVDEEALARLPRGDERVGEASAGTHSSPTGRAARELADLRSITEGTLHAEMVKQPRKVYGIADLLTAASAVDEDWSSVAMLRFAFSLHHLRSADVSFVVAGRAEDDLWDALGADDAHEWVLAHPDDLVRSAA